MTKHTYLTLLLIILLPLVVSAQSVIDWKEPTTDKEWAEDVKQESLDVKHDYQLGKMKNNLKVKLPKLEKKLDKVTNYPDTVKWESKARYTDAGMAIDNTTLNKVIKDEQVKYQWEVDKIKQSIKRIEKEQDLRNRGVIKRKPIGTTYYVESGAGGSDADTGLTTALAWKTLDKFCENARSAGDKLVIRCGSGFIAASDLDFTSDGDLSNPIIMEADYDNAWGDHANALQTYTVAYGSTTLTASATITDFKIANSTSGYDIYISGDDNRLYSYKANKNLGGTAMILDIPYKGEQTGSGNTVVNMGLTGWNVWAGSYQLNIDTDNYWKIQGLYFVSADPNGAVEIDDSLGVELRDCWYRTVISTAIGVLLTGSDNIVINKNRFLGMKFGVIGTALYSWGRLLIKDSFLDALSIAGSCNIYVVDYINTVIIDTELKGAIVADIINGSSSTDLSHVRMRNTKLNSNDAIEVVGTGTDASYTTVYSEDHDGTVGLNRQYSSLSSAANTAVIESSTSVIRAGGGSSSIKVTPGGEIGSVWELSNLQLFEYPIYADTTSKTYTVYFYSSNIANWTADPTAAQLWIEAEYWNTDITATQTNGFDGNKRKKVKSTGLVDFNGSTAWQSLTVTVQPVKAGILYLRGFYAKTKEAGKSNIFYVDVVPVIS